MSTELNSQTSTNEQTTTQPNIDASVGDANGNALKDPEATTDTQPGDKKEKVEPKATENEGNLLTKDPSGEPEKPKDENKEDLSHLAEWRRELPAEIRGHKCLDTFIKPDDVIAAYVHAQKIIGADKIPIPSKHATPEEWDIVFQKLGKPKGVDAYEIERKNAEYVPDEALNSFKEVAFKANILPHQAQEVISWYEKVADQGIKQQQQESLMQKRKSLDELRSEWGTAFDNKVLKAQMAVREYATEEDIDYLNQHGLSDDSRLVRIFARIGETFSEDKIRDAHLPKGGLTPQEAQDQVNEIISNPSHPYFDMNHPNHKKAVEEMEGLYRAINPN